MKLAQRTWPFFSLDQLADCWDGKWSDGKPHDEYNLADYFEGEDGSLTYLGPDDFGIEPIFEPALVIALAIKDNSRPVRVRGGDGEDMDTGEVKAVGRMATVKWDSGVTTPAPWSELELI